MDLEGAMYVPAAKITFPAFISATISHYGIYVAKNIELQGVIGALIDYANAPGTGGTSPIKTTVLAE